MARAREAEQLPFIQKLGTFNIEVVVETFGGWVFNIETLREEGIDEEAFRSFLMSFRPFVSKKEDLYLHAVYGLAEQFVTDDAAKAMIAKSKAQLEGAILKGPLRLHIDGQRLHPNETMKLYFNGIYFHLDKKKRNKLKRFPISFTRYEFLCAVIITFNHIAWMQRILTYAFNNGFIIDKLD